VQDLGARSDNNSQLKKEILELTDRLYHSWKEVRICNLQRREIVSEYQVSFIIGKQFIITTQFKYYIK
jgi:hypothetical protein